MTEEADSGGDTFPVVGIGASAGGLDALNAFFDNVPAQSGTAYIVAQHLDPTHESLMAELLSRHVDLPVTLVQRRTPLQPDHVYVMPPNRDLSVKNGALVPSKPKETRGRRLPIDHLFRTMAADLKARVICIVLSGTGSDGSLDIKVVKEHGGMVMVQEPNTAAHDGMPRNAIATGMADLVLPAEAMPEALLHYIAHPYLGHSKQTALPIEDSDDILSRIIAVIRARLNQDFRNYKKSTLLRRIERRMGLRRVDKLADYLALLRKEEGEVRLLGKDLLISVTRFFRDPTSFEALAREFAEYLAESAEPGLPIRVWVVGCATGEEAYSVAIVLMELLGSGSAARELQIFATDIDAQALDVARAGLYSEGIRADVSPERLRRFFVKEADGYRINQQVRSCITFAEQNLLSDPPFSRLDLITCRNLMIYIEPEMQAKILSLFHYALGPGRYLFLGGSETIGRRRDLFKSLDRKARIYQRIGVDRAQQVSIPLLPGTGSRLPESPNREAKLTPATGLVEMCHRLLSEEFAPPSLIIDGKGEPLYFFGSADRYLRLPTGVPNQPVTVMARDGLQSVLRRLIKQARQSGEVARTAAVPVKLNGETIRVKVEARPTTVGKDVEGPLIVSFIEEPSSRAQEAEAQSPMLDRDGTVQELENELQTTREDLQSTIEELETANEEMKASNEEAMSMNEELQSTNEELATSKEEMQSLNEELSTVNLELQQRTVELEGTNDDLINLLDSTDVATLFLDKDLLIRRFTASIARLIKLTPADIGRPVTDFSMNFTDPRLIPDAEAVLDRLVPIDREIKTLDGAWYVRHISPFRTQADKIEGAVITFIDITDRKRSEADMRRLATVVRDSNDAITVQDLQGKILAWNRGAELMYGYKEAEALGINIMALVPQDCYEETRTLLKNLAAGREIKSFETKRVTKDGRVLDVSLVVTAIRDEADDGSITFATTERDLTRLREIEARMESNRRLAALGQLTGGIAHDFNNLLAVIMGNSELLAAKLGSKDRLLNGILRSAERGAELTQRLLAFSRRQPLRPETFDIGALITAMSPLIERTLGETITVETVVATGLWPVLADLGQVENALLNLAINARDAMPDGGRLTIECRNETLDEAYATQHTEIEAGDYVVLSVRDTGVGMSPKVKNKVFEPFFTTKEVGKGSGLGLSMVFGFAKQSGGQVTIESEENQGTNVKLYLRRAEQRPSPKRKRAEGRVPSGKGELVLVVEDDPDVGDLTVKMLEGLGYRVVYATEAESAQTLLEQEKIDLLLSDVVLPGGISGPEFAEAARQRNPDIKVIFMSGYPAEASKSHDILAPGSVLLNKPFRRSELAKVVSEMLRR